MNNEDPNYWPDDLNELKGLPPSINTMERRVKSPFIERKEFNNLVDRLSKLEKKTDMLYTLINAKIRKVTKTAEYNTSVQNSQNSEG
jgi:hypothetical protein|tara:strand:+ start:424 stop:684 length:261 start_codon:yes stop_codon:yes gene_type:complete